MTQQQHDAVKKCIADALKGFEKTNAVTISIREILLLGYPPGPNGPSFQNKLVVRFDMVDVPDLTPKTFSRKRKPVEET